MDRLRPRTTGSARGGACTAPTRRRWPQGRSPHAPDLEPARHRANGRSPLRPRSPGPVSAPLRALRSGLATLPAHASCRNRDGRPVLSGILEASSSLRSSRAFCEALRERFPQGARASRPRESPGPDHGPAGRGPRFRPCTTCLADPGRRLVGSFQVLFMTLLRSGCQSSALSPPKGRGDHAEGSGEAPAFPSFGLPAPSRDAGSGRRESSNRDGPGNREETTAIRRARDRPRFIAMTRASGGRRRACIAAPSPKKTAAWMDRSATNDRIMTLHINQLKFFIPEKSWIGFLDFDRIPQTVNQGEFSLSGYGRPSGLIAMIRRLIRARTSSCGRSGNAWSRREASP